MRPFFLLSCFISIYLISCSPVYISNTWNVPAITEKHEFIAVGNLGHSGLDCQMAYSLTNHIGIMANGSFSKSRSPDYHKHLFAEGGLGYSFQPVQGLIVEIYGGYGLGDVSSSAESFHFYTPKIEKINATLERFFIQPSVSYKSDFLQLSFAPRFSFVNIKPKEIDGLSSGYVSFAEPAIIVKLGNGPIRMVNQIGLSLDILSEKESSEFTSRFESAAFYFSLGIQLSLGGKKNNH